MRKAKGIPRAIERLARHLPGVRVEKHGKLYSLDVPASGAGPTNKRPARALAFLADLAKRQDNRAEIRQAVAWTGTAPAYLAAWEAAALDWLTLSDGR